MKSQGDMLLQVAIAYLEDAQLAYANQVKEFSRDAISLTRGYQTRGLAFFTLDLPSLDEVLTSGLEGGILSAKGPLTGRRSKVDLRPKLFFGLWRLVFDHNGCLLENADPNAIFFLRSLFCLGKKIAVACTPARLQKAVKDYHAIESEVLPPILNWQADDLFDGYSGRSYRFRDSFMLSDELPLFGESRKGGRDLAELLFAMDRIGSLLSADLGAFDPFTDGESISADGSRDYSVGRYRHGPGAVADSSRHAFKYDFPNWPSKLQGYFPYDWCGSHTIHIERYPSSHEPPSKLIAVPKTAKGPRLIASEPTAHQWCQQKIATWLDARYRSTLVGRFVALNRQDLSRDMVSAASARRDLATVDLSSASDRLSCRHVESLFRANCTLLEAVHAVRTRSVKDTISKPTNFRQLRKFAAQGSALTFPVQSLFFLVCALASCGATDRKSISELEGRVRVYGDDIIIPVEAYARLVFLFDHLGLRVNPAKCFWRGGFRESCGSDCFNGFNVTPLKPKTLVPDTPQSCQALLDQSNNLYLMGLWKASAVLKSALQSSGYRIPVVGLDCGVPAYKSFLGPDLDSFVTRRNQNLHRDEVRVFLLKNGNTRIKQDSSATLLQYFTEAPGPDIKWSSGVTRNRAATFAPRWVDFDVVVA